MLLWLRSRRESLSNFTRADGCSGRHGDAWTGGAGRRRATASGTGSLRLSLGLASSESGSLRPGSPGHSELPGPLCDASARGCCHCTSVTPELPQWPQAASARQCCLPVQRRDPGRTRASSPLTLPEGLARLARGHICRSGPREWQGTAASPWQVGGGGCATVTVPWIRSPGSGCHWQPE